MRCGNQWWMLLGVVTLMLVGAGCWETAQSKVARESKKFTNALGRGDWAMAGQVLATDFRYVNSKGKEYAPGRDEFLNRFREVAGRESFSVDSDTTAKATAGGYVETIKATMQAGGWNYLYEMKLLWKQSGARWQVAQAHMMGLERQRRDTGDGPAVTTAAKAPTNLTPAAAAGSGAEARDVAAQHTFGTISGEVRAGADYAIGATQLKVKKNIQNKLQQANQQRDENVRKAMSN